MYWAEHGIAHLHAIKGEHFERIGPMNEPLQDEFFFARVFLENGALTWPNGYDLSPWNVRKRMEAAGALRAHWVAAE